jgi:transmembrane sensor
VAEIHRLPEAHDVEREASEWIARLEADDTSDEDRSRFSAWYGANRQHAKVYDDLRGLLHEFRAAGPLVRAVAFGQAMNEAGRPKSQRLRWVAAMAASLTVAVLATTWYLRRPTVESVQTAIGERATLSLPDGSSLELNSNSLARIAYSAHARVIELVRGESYCVVVHDAKRSFSMRVGSAVIRDIGTSFDVDKRPQLVRVTVTEGELAVSPTDPGREAFPDALHDRPGTEVAAGEQAEVAGSEVTLRKLPREEFARFLGWRSGELHFDDEPLSDVINELSRYTTLHLVLRDASLARTPVGGTFQASPQGTTTLVAMLKDGLGLSVRQSGDTVYISHPAHTPAH